MTRNGAAAQRDAAPEQLARHTETENMDTETPLAILDSITCRATPTELAFHGDPSVNAAPSPNPRVVSEQLVSEEVLTKNRMTLLHLEQTNALAPGILTISPTGELHLSAHFSPDPDDGTMAGYFPNQSPSAGVDSQIPTWLREYLLKELNVHGHGPPANCRAFYDHLLDAREDFALNNSVRSTEGALAYAVISLRYAIEEVRSFVAAKYLSEETYEEEVRLVVKNVKRMVGYQGEEMSMELRLLVELAGMGATMKEALGEPLESLVVAPYTRLVGRLELVSKALRIELDRVDLEAEKTPRDDAHTPDSGISGC